jgi:hypothetical protein
MKVLLIAHAITEVGRLPRDPRRVCVPAARRHHWQRIQPAVYFRDVRDTQTSLPFGPQ